nr:hypothetical protein [uncultured Roseococcus sp.]
MDLKIVGPWAVRMLLLALGGWLTRVGIGDAGLWGNVADTLAGPLVVAGTAVWSWYATRAQIEAPPEDRERGPAAAEPASYIVMTDQQFAELQRLSDQMEALRRDIINASMRPVA